VGFFQVLKIVTGWLVPPGWYFPPQKILLAENRFLQAGKGAENTKKKSRQCYYTAPRTRHGMDGKGTQYTDQSSSKLQGYNRVLTIVIT
jgi:hypothetical protein